MKYFSPLLYACLILLLLSVPSNASPIKPIPDSIDFDKKKAELGKKLFFDSLLSKDGSISCATCHDLQNGGDDGLKFSFGIKGQKGSINAPTVYNAVFNFRQFWDGRAKDLKTQAKGPIENPVEMGHRFSDLIPILENNKVYKQAFHTLYPDDITEENIADAIAEFEKALITPDAPFDRYLKGEKDAITAQEKRGYRLFSSKGCILCHNGVNVGGNFYNKFGIFKEVPTVQSWDGTTLPNEKRTNMSLKCLLCVT